MTFGAPLPPPLCLLCEQPGHVVGECPRNTELLTEQTPVRVCSEHDEELIWEPGGFDRPTLYGRWYCPTCQEIFMRVLRSETRFVGDKERS